LLGGPGGALGGAAVGWAAGEALPRLCREVIARVGERAATRTAAAVVLMDADARDRAERGESPRTDGFFEPRGEDLSSDSDELLEAVLRQAAETYEEQKLPYLSRIYTAVAHDPGVPAADAQYLSAVASDLTYRQLVALSVLAHHGEHEEALINATVNQTEGSSVRDPALRLELTDLVNRQLVGVGDEHQASAIGDPLEALHPRSQVGFGQLRLLPVGQTLVRLMGLEQIGSTERQEWIKQLGGIRD
jgi:hypothetical protein